MRALALVALGLGGCSSMSGPADWVLPDEFTLGRGSSTSALRGDVVDSYGWHDFDLDGTSENESTYAALTWDLPGVQKSDGMSRETQRNMALLIDKMVADEIGEVEEEPTSMTLRDGAPTPPWWLPYVFGGGILLFLAFMGIKSRGNGWH